MAANLEYVYTVTAPQCSSVPEMVAERNEHGSAGWVTICTQYVPAIIQRSWHLWVCSTEMKSCWPNFFTVTTSIELSGCLLHVCAVIKNKLLFIYWLAAIKGQRFSRPSGKPLSLTYLGCAATVTTTNLKYLALWVLNRSRARIRIS